MKSYTVGLFSGLATLISVIYSEAQCDCPNNQPTDQYPQYTQNQNNYDLVTVTVTQTAPSVIVINAVTVTQPAPYENQASYNQPSPPASYGAASSATSYDAKQTHRVEVEKYDDKLQFVPNQINAAIENVMKFDFLIQSHSLTQSEFLTLCTYNGEFDTDLNQMNLKNQSDLFVIPFEVKTDKPQ